MASSFELRKYFKDNKRAQQQKFNAARRANRPGSEGWLDLNFTGLDTKPVIVFVKEKRGDAGKRCARRSFRDHEASLPPKRRRQPAGHRPVSRGLDDAHKLGLVQRETGG